jgi:hypothetical protein
MRRECIPGGAADAAWIRGSAQGRKRIAQINEELAAFESREEARLKDSPVNGTTATVFRPMSDS